MFRKLYNQALLTGTLVPDGPLLVVQGGVAHDPSAPDLAFVRTVRAGRSTVYLPGSSLKGALRAYAERLLATYVGVAAAEDPFRQEASPRRQAAAAAREKGSTPEVFRLSCEADRLFGSTEIAGRLRVSDALPPPAEEAAANRTEVRYGVAIDRAKQSVKAGPFEQEAVTQGSFALQVTLENFDLWMLSLLLQCLADLHAGLIPLGHGKTRGFGTVRLDSPKLVLRWPGRAPAELRGAGACEPDEEVRHAYGLSGDDRALLPAGGATAAFGLFSGYGYDGWPGLEAVLGALAGGPWARFLAEAVPAAPATPAAAAEVARGQ